jgi:hypothetical protein
MRHRIDIALQTRDGLHDLVQAFGMQVADRV